MDERITLLRAMATIRRDVAEDQKKNGNEHLASTLRKEASIIELCADIMEDTEKYKGYREIYEDWLIPEDNEK